MPYVFTALMGVFAGIYAFIRHSAGLFGRVFFKTAASVMFVLIAYSARIEASRDYYVLILLGLCASLTGDALLLFTNRGKAFAAGGFVCFTAAHLFYICAFWTVASPSWVDAIFFVSIMTLAVSAILAQRVSLGRYTPVLYAYIAVLAAMTARALSMLWVKDVPPLFAAFTAAGGVLFAVSDALLGLEHQTGRRAVGAAGTFVYYSAQALIALSVMLQAP